MTIFMTDTILFYISRFYKAERSPRSFNSVVKWFEFCTVEFTLINQKPRNYCYYGAFVR